MASLAPAPRLAQGTPAAIGRRSPETENPMRRLAILASLLSAQALAAPVPNPTDPDDGTRIICRREVPTGSLIPTRKACRTQAQWDALARGSQAMAQDLVERHRGAPSCFSGGGC
ncbi:hypothetical protein [Thermaurantiacus sp.]